MLQEYSRILTPVDGSLESELAFKKAVEVAVRNRATIVIAHVVDTQSIHTPTGYEGTYREELYNQANVILDDFNTYALEHGVVNVEKFIDYGSPKYQIANEIPKEHNIDLIMIGATGLNAVERFFIGSVSEYVIRNAPCDVLVVRTDLENKEFVKEP